MLFRRSRIVDPSGCSYRLLQSAEELLSIKAQWDRLWAEAGAEYFLSCCVILQCWNTIYRPQGAALCCAVACDGQQLLAVLPMVLRRHRFSSTAMSCGPRAAECCDMLIKSSAGSPAIAAALLEKFVLLARPDFLEFDFVRLASHLGVAIQQAAALHILETWDSVVPYADLQAEQDWPSYTRSLSKRYQADCARCCRRLSEQGKVTVEIVRGTPTPLIDWLFLHKRRWSERTRKRGDWVFSRHYQQFVNALFASDPRYLVFALKLDDVPIAVKLLAVNTNSASLVLITYDESYKRFSPGNILDETMMEHVFENYRSGTRRHLDVTFGPGAESFKLHWSRGNTQPARSYRIVTSRWGAARLRARRALAALRQH